MRLVFAALVASLCLSPALAADDDSGAVQRLMMQTFDKPEARLSVAPIVVDGDVAVAGWSQGELGGRALLRKKGGAWSIDLCAGDALKQSATLEKLGLSRARAEQVANTVAREESKLDPTLLARFSKFDGAFAVDASGAHSAVDPHHRRLP